MKFQEWVIKQHETAKPVRNGKQPGPWPIARLLSTSLHVCSGRFAGCMLKHSPITFGVNGIGTGACSPYETWKVLVLQSGTFNKVDVRLLHDIDTALFLLWLHIVVLYYNVMLCQPLLAIFCVQKNKKWQEFQLSGVWYRSAVEHRCAG